MVGAAVTEPVACGVKVITGVLVALKVGVKGPGYPGGVFVITGPGYPCEVLVTKGPGYCWLVGRVCGPGYAGVTPVVGFGLAAATVAICVIVADGNIVAEACGITGCVLVLIGAGYGVGLENGTRVCPGGCGYGNKVARISTGWVGNGYGSSVGEATTMLVTVGGTVIAVTKGVAVSVPCAMVGAG